MAKARRRSSKCKPIGGKRCMKKVGKRKLFCKCPKGKKSR